MSTNKLLLDYIYEHEKALLTLLNQQPEFTTPLWDYLSGLVDDQRVADGRAALDAHRDLLARVSQAYGKRLHGGAALNGAVGWI